MKRVNEEDRDPKKSCTGLKHMKARLLLTLHRKGIQTKNGRSQEILSLCKEILEIDPNDEFALYEQAIRSKSIKLYQDYVNRGCKINIFVIYHNIALHFEAINDFENAMKYYELSLLHGAGCNFKANYHYWHFLKHIGNPRALVYLHKCIRIAEMEPKRIKERKKYLNFFMHLLTSLDNERALKISTILDSPFRHLTILSKDAYVNWNILTKVHQLEVSEEIKDNLQYHANIQTHLIKSCKTDLEDTSIDLILKFLFQM